MKKQTPAKQEIPDDHALLRRLSSLLPHVCPPREVIRNLLSAGHKYHSLLVVAPFEHTQLLGIACCILVIPRTREVSEQEAGSSLHALAFDLPESDLVDDGGGEDVGGFLHLRVRVNSEVVDDLICGDT